MNTRHIYFVPFGQDDAIKKPTSLVAKTEMIPDAVEAALKGEQRSAGRGQQNSD